MNRQTAIEAQTWILMTQVAEEIRSASQHAVVVCDRSVLDNYAYLALACGRQKPIERFVDHWMTTYDLLFKVPLSTPPVSAHGVRDTDQFFMRSIDELVDPLLHEKKIPHEGLPSVPLERARRGGGRGAGGGGGREGGAEILPRQRIALGEDEGALDHVPELAHVPPPGLDPEQLQGLGGDAAGLPEVPPAGRGREVEGE